MLAGSNTLLAENWFFPANFKDVNLPEAKIGIGAPPQLVYNNVSIVVSFLYNTVKLHTSPPDKPLDGGHPSVNCKTDPYEIKIRLHSTAAAPDQACTQSKTN